MDEGTLKVSVEEKIGIQEVPPGPQVNKRAFVDFLKENGYVDDGTFIVTIRKDKEQAVLWKKVSTFNGKIT